MKAGIFAILGTLVITTGASASMISYSANIATQPAEFTDSFNLSQFNTNLGTLTGVTLELNAIGSADSEILNLTGSPGAYTDATATFDFSLTGPGGSSVQVPLTAGPFSGTAPTDASFDPGDPVNGDFTTSVSSVNWADYEGSGVVALTAGIGAGAYTGSQSSGLGDMFFGGTASGGGTAEVIYTYTPAPVPEPATWALLGSVLLGFGTMRRRVRALTEK